jgi:acetyl-CoA acetyltransferase
MSKHSVVVVAPLRTAIGTFGGSLKEIPAPELGAAAIRAAVARAVLDPEEIGTVVMGNVVQAGAKMNPARQAAIHAGLPVSVPAMTVNRVCGSGAQAIVSAAQEIFLGSIRAAVAGGMENMDLAPYLIARGRWGYRMGDGQLYDSMLRDGSTMRFRISRRAGTRRIWSANSGSAERRRTCGRCARSNALPPHKRLASSSMRSLRSRCPDARVPPCS